MSAPRQLWSGDWEQDSAAHAEALARRNAQRVAEPPAEDARPEPRIAPRTAATERLGPTLRERLVALAATLGRGLLELLRWVGLAVIALAKGLRAIVRGGWRALRRADRARLRLVAIAVLLIAVVAVAAVALFGSGGSSNGKVSAEVASVSRWLGVQLTDVPSRGVVMEYLDQNGAAADEGFEPGDTIAQIDNRAINRLGDVAKVFQGVEPGDQITITVDRGSSVYSANFPMPPHPPGGP